METLIVSLPSERVTVDGDRTEWRHDGALVVYADDTEIAEFPTADWVARADNLQ